MRTRAVRRNLGVAAGALLVALGCGTAPKPVPVAAGPAAAPSLLVDVARRCARIASCSDPHDPSNFRTAQACVDWWLVNARDESPLADCVMKAKTCLEVEACTHAPGDPGAESFCKAHPGTLSTCDGTRYISCEDRDPRESTASECAALGGTCGEIHGAGLVLRGCIAPKLCPSDAPTLRCDGEKALIDCEGGIAERRVCPQGSRCVPEVNAEGDPSATCESSTGRRCGLPGSAFCDGDRAVVCVQNGRFTGMHVGDCGRYGMGCIVRAGRANCVRKETTGCAGPAACEGDTLRFCAAGGDVRVPCKELGFTGCNPTGAGTEASCTYAEESPTAPNR